MKSRSKINTALIKNSHIAAAASVFTLALVALLASPIETTLAVKATTVANTSVVATFRNAPSDRVLSIGGPFVDGQNGATVTLGYLLTGRGQEIEYDLTDPITGDLSGVVHGGASLSVTTPGGFSAMQSGGPAQVGEASFNIASEKFRYLLRFYRPAILHDDRYYSDTYPVMITRLSAQTWEIEAPGQQTNLLIGEVAWDVARLETYSVTGKGNGYSNRISRGNYYAPFKITITVGA